MYYGDLRVNSNAKRKKGIMLFCKLCVFKFVLTRVSSESILKLRLKLLHGHFKTNISHIISGYFFIWH